MKTGNAASTLIDALGGTAAVAALTVGRMPAVSNWRRRGAIPSRWLRRLEAEADKRGIPVDYAAFSLASEAAA